MIYVLVLKHINADFSNTHTSYYMSVNFIICKTVINKHRHDCARLMFKPLNPSYKTVVILHYVIPNFSAVLNMPLNLQIIGKLKK
jgi:hypothetical protein